jgi:prefoldin subunit 5
MTRQEEAEELESALASIEELQAGLAAMRRSLQHMERTLSTIKSAVDSSQKHATGAHVYD